MLGTHSEDGDIKLKLVNIVETWGLLVWATETEVVYMQAKWSTVPLIQGSNYAGGYRTFALIVEVPRPRRPVTRPTTGAQALCSSVLSSVVGRESSESGRNCLGTGPEVVVSLPYNSYLTLGTTPVNS